MVMWKSSEQMTEEELAAERAKARATPVSEFRPRYTPARKVRQIKQDNEAQIAREQDAIRCQARAASRRRRDLVPFIHHEELHPVDIEEARFGIREDY